MAGLVVTAAQLRANPPPQVFRGEDLPSSTPATSQSPGPPVSAAPSRRTASGWIGGLLERVFGRSAEPPAADAGPLAPPVSSVLIAASAPRSCKAGTPFVAALAAYVEAARDSALRHLAELCEPGDRFVHDVDASPWAIGAPVTVRLSAEGARIVPEAFAYEWNGRERIAAFSVTADPATTLDAMVLQFEVFVADVAVASLPLRVTVAATVDARPGTVQARAARRHSRRIRRWTPPSSLSACRRSRAGHRG